MARYGQAFKDRAVARLLPPESAALEPVALEVGVGAGALLHCQEDAQTRPALGRAWSVPARFEAVVNTGALVVREKKALCSEQGIYSEDLEKWGSNAMAGGARLRLACDITRNDLRTLQRWKVDECFVQVDGRPQALRNTPGHVLSEDERVKVLSVANELSFASVPPARIAPMLADEGVYIASGSNFARVLLETGQDAHRRRAKAPKAARPLTIHIASCPRQVWCWDMTYLPAADMGMWFHLYLILDVFSRKIVGWEVHDTDHSDHAVHLVRRTAFPEGIDTLVEKPVLHSDNGSTLKATTVLVMLNWLCVKLTYSRPHVSDYNAYAESLFRTAKYRPEFPAKCFANLDAARVWAAEYVHWYNIDHCRSCIQYVSPAQRHEGDNPTILAARHALYLKARQENPASWSGNTRNWSPIGAVTLKPERDCIINAQTDSSHIQRLAA